jgi:hypothetical protein
MFPPVWQGRYFYGDYVRGWIRYLQFDTLGQVVDDQPFVDPATFGGDTALALVKLLQGPDGALYYITLIDDQVNFTGSVHRIFTLPDQAPVCGTVTALPASGPGPLLTTMLVASATDAEGGALTYAWTFGDGSATANGDTVFHTYSGPGTFTAQLVRWNDRYFLWGRSRDRWGPADRPDRITRQRLHVPVRRCDHLLRSGYGRWSIEPVQLFLERGVQP